MREIKFRAWNSVLHEYRTLDMNSGNHNLGMGFEVTGGIGSNITTIYRSVGDIIEQFIGLKDKNGVQIYEGDIVKTVGENIYVVEFFDGKFNPISDFKDGVWEVIGNVNQNADLLAADIARMIPDDIGNDIHEFLHGGDR